MRRTTALLSVVSTLLAGCATGMKYAEFERQLPALKDGQGRIIVYRPNAVGFGVRPVIYLNDTEIIGQSQGMGFFYTDRPAGQYQCSATTEVKRSVSFPLESGETKYVRTQVTIGFLVGRLQFELADEFKAEAELQSCSYTGDWPPPEHAAEAEEVAASAAQPRTAAVASTARPADPLPPTPDPKGGLTFEFANADWTRQGGSIMVVKFSERPGDAVEQGRSVTDGVLTVRGKVGLGAGSKWAGMGPRFGLGALLDVSRFRSITVRLAATTRDLRVALGGSTEDNTCYPVYTIEVDGTMREYTIPLDRFAPESWCGSKAHDVRETLKRLTSIEVVSTRITGQPVTLSVGPTTLNRQ